jgi:hypothetical protein
VRGFDNPPSLIGPDQMRAGFKQVFAMMKNIRCRITQQAIQDNVVFVKRIESCLFLGKHLVELHLVGVLEIGRMASSSPL